MINISNYDSNNQLANLIQEGSDDGILIRTYSDDVYIDSANRLVLSAGTYLQINVGSQIYRISFSGGYVRYS